MAGRRALAVILTLVALPFAAPAGSAGTEADPEIDGSPDQEEPTVDLLAAWVENVPGGVRFTIKVAKLAAVTRDSYYGVWATPADGGSMQIAMIILGEDGQTLSSVGPPGPQGTPETRANGALRDVERRNGEPGYLSAVIPEGASAIWVEGATLTPPREDVTEGYGGFTGVYQRERTAWVDMDLVPATRDFTVESVLLAPEHGSLLLWAAVAGAVVGLSFVAWRRFRRSATRPRGPATGWERPAAAGLDVRRVALLAGAAATAAFVLVAAFLPWFSLTAGASVARVDIDYHLGEARGTSAVAGQEGSFVNSYAELGFAAQGRVLAAARAVVVIAGVLAAGALAAGVAVVLGLLPASPALRAAAVLVGLAGAAAFGSAAYVGLALPGAFEEDQGAGGGALTPAEAFAGSNAGTTWGPSAGWYVAAAGLVPAAVAAVATLELRRRPVEAAT